MFVIASKHEAFGKLYLGRTSPVVKRKSALKFPTREAAQSRIEFWQALAGKPEENLDPKFFGNMYIEEYQL